MQTGECEFAFTELRCASGCADNRRCRVAGDVLAQSSYLAGALTEVAPDTLVMSLPLADGSGSRLQALHSDLTLLSGYAWDTTMWAEAGTVVGLASTPRGEAVVLGTRFGSVLSLHENLALVNAEAQAAWVATQSSTLGAYDSRASVCVAQDGTVYFAGRSALVALAPDGRERFRIPMPTPHGGRLCALVSDSVWVVCSAGESCAGYMPNDGRVLWEQPWPASLLLLDDAGTLLVGSGSTLIRAHAPTGESLASVALTAAGVDVVLLAAVTDEEGGVVVSVAPRSAASFAGNRLVRLRQVDLELIGEAQIAMRAQGLAATALGSTVATGACIDATTQLPNYCVASYDAAFALGWQYMPQGAATSVSEPWLQAEGSVLVTFGNLGLFRILAYEPLSHSAWPCARADAARSGRFGGL